MNTNCVLWDPLLNIWSGQDVKQIQNFVKQYFFDKYRKYIIVPSEKIFHLLLITAKTSKPRVGDIYTRCLLDNEIPDQFYSKYNIMFEVFHIIISQIEDDISIENDSFNIWKSVLPIDMNFYTKPKLNDRKPKTIISMKF